MTTNTPHAEPRRHKRRGRFLIVDKDSAARAALEARIRAGFGQHFEACVEGFMPNLAVYEQPSGCRAVAGFRSALEERLFLEDYLDTPIEAEIAARTGAIVGRAAIVEVGQFVVDDRETVFEFFTELVPFLRRLGFRWICFTATNKIRALLARIGFHGVPIAIADPSRIADSNEKWGRYYDNDPMVVVGDLHDPSGTWFRSSSESSNDAHGAGA